MSTMGNRGISLEIQKAFGKMDMVSTTGVYAGTVWLTPPDVMGVLNEKKDLWKSEAFEPRSEFRLYPEINSIPIKKWTWEVEGENVTVGVYQGGIKFPDVCCQCTKKKEKEELVEVGILAHSGSFQTYDQSQETVDKVTDAIFMKRYWYAIPFCKDHGLKSRCIHIEDSNEALSPGLFIFGFTNREFSRLFKELNSEKGRWLDKNNLRNKTFSYFLGMFFFICFMGGLVTTGLNIQGNPSPLSLPLSTTLMIVGILGIANAIRLYMKNKKGENI